MVTVDRGWAISTFEFVVSLSVMGGNLYAGLGASANDAEVWRWNGSTWTKIGGDSLNSGWTTNFETVRSLPMTALMYMQELATQPKTPRCGAGTARLRPRSAEME